MLFYRAALPLSSKTLNYVAGIIRRRRAAIGSAWRKLNPGRAGDWVRGRHVLAELEAAGLVTLADKGYLASTHAKDPSRGKKKRNRRKRRTALMRSSARPAKGRVPCSRTGGYSASFAAAPGAPASSPRPSTPLRSTPRNQDEKAQRPGRSGGSVAYHNVSGSCACPH